MRMRGTAFLPALSLYVGRQLVWLAEETSAAAMLRSLALVVSHGTRLMSSSICLPPSPAMAQPDHIETTAWRAMLGKDEREVSDEEIAALEAEHGSFQAADGEG